MKILLALLVVLSPSVAAQTTPVLEITEERIVAAYADVRAAVRDVLGVEVDPALQPRLVSSKEIGARVAEENLTVIQKRQPDPDLARREADEIGRTFGLSALAKYTWTTKELLVSAKGWRRQAIQMKRPGLTSDACLRAVLAHETVHALDDARHDIGKVLGGLATIDAIQGFTGVFEGHAQLLARRICAKRGWSEGFDLFSTNIRGLPEGAESLAAAQLDTLRAQGAVMAAPYVAGETFLAAVEARGPEAVARAFREPPDSPDLLYRPDWWLDPSKRPKSKVAMAATLDAFAARYPADAWASTRVALPRAGLEAAMLRLDRDRVTKTLDERVTSMTISLQPRADPSSKFLMMALHEFVDVPSALAFFDLGTELGRARDEDMRRSEASMRLLETTTEPLAGEGWKATAERRKLDNAGFQFVVTAVRVHAGAVVLELVLSNEPADGAELTKRVNEALATARGS